MMGMMTSCLLTQRTMQEEKGVIISFCKSPDTINWLLEGEQMAAHRSVTISLETSQERVG